MCATSIGSTFSQSPSPGLLKSGIPLGTEIPAPVRATVQLDSRISSARSLADLAVDAGGVLEDVKTVSVSERAPPAAAALLPRPSRTALLQERGDPLLAI